METEQLIADPAGFDRAVALLQAGAQVAFPTETVYGLGADATNDQAVAGIFAAKDRPRFNPLIVHLPDVADIARYVHLTPLGQQITSAFFPGPISIVAKLRDNAGLSDLVTAGLNTVALRVPGHPVACQLLAQFGGPIAAPSANPSGKISATTAGHVLAGLSGRIAAVLDGGACDVGLESTILDVTGEVPVLLRSGGVPVEAIEAMTGPVSQSTSPTKINAPGQLASHYAPEALLRLNANAPRKGELFLGFGPNAKGADITLSRSGDLVEAAANFFAAMRDIDEFATKDGNTVAVSPIPETGLGMAINDRLLRAAAPRD